MPVAIFPTLSAVLCSGAVGEHCGTNPTVLPVVLTSTGTGLDPVCIASAFARPCASSASDGPTTVMVGVPSGPIVTLPPTGYAPVPAGSNPLGSTYARG